MQAFIAFLTSIPKLVELVDLFVAAYTQIRMASMKKEIRDGIKKAVELQNQIDLEKAIGNPHAGEPTHYPGTSISDQPPHGVREQK